MSRSARLAAPMALLVAVLIGCGSDDGAATTAAAPRSSEPLVGSIVVSAASSLTDVFSDIGDAFVATHPDVRVAFNFGSSGQLSSQILDGAPADVVAFADVAPMEALGAARLLERAPQVFAGNRLVIVTAPGNPEGVTGAADLADVGIVSLCAASAPCGEYTSQVLSAAGVAIPEERITRGQDVRATRTAVTEGDAVAAIVYATDAVAAGDAVAVVELPEADEVVASYPIAVLASSESQDLALAFVDFVRSPAGQRILGDAGFLAP